MILKRFTEHPHSVGESYGRHMLVAFGVAGRLAVAFWAVVVHAVFPFLFPTTGSRILRGLLSERDRRGGTGRGPDAV